VDAPRLKSSFIYLANAVSDLRANWALLAIVLAPLVLTGALCLMPDAINWQARLAHAFEPSGQHVSFVTPAQEPYAPDRNATPVPEEFPGWMTTSLHFVFLLVTTLATLVAMCTLRRLQSGAQSIGLTGDAIAVWTDAVHLLPGYLWVALLQYAVPVASLTMMVLWSAAVASWLGFFAWLLFIIVLGAGALVYQWLYFARYALVFDGHRSFRALLHSRDVMRKRFFRVALRIVVFGAVWSGYNSWSAGLFIFVSLVAGPAGYLAGKLVTTLFVVDLMAIAVTYGTVAFFVAAGLRLYRDLTATIESGAAVTVPLQSVQSASN
jgi:hypothetical protein